MADTFSVPIHLFGVTYAAGDALPTMAAPVRQHLLDRGYIAPSVIKAQRDFSDSGTAYAKGATIAAGTFTGTKLRRLLQRGRYLGP